MVWSPEMMETKILLLLHLIFSSPLDLEPFQHWYSYCGYREALVPHPYYNWQMVIGGPGTECAFGAQDL